ncbi:MAG: ABC transporter ATP-binding protein [Thermodesulfovibrionales bacterium]|nr:ABC transporter ATP-binding protein [Thermodesulfovibrionales bacterium]
MATATIHEDMKTGKPQDMTAEDTLLSIEGVTKHYNTKSTGFLALKGVDISVEKGEFLAITGESGSGKSTLLSILGGIAPPTEGRIVVDGIDIYALPIESQADFRREYIGFVFQQFHLMPYLSAIENVMLPLTITGRTDREMREMARTSLERVGLGDKAANLPSELSGGQQQRVAVARALVNAPPIILADEPTGNLDTKTGQDVFNLFQDLNEAGETVILVTHNTELASRTRRTVRLCDGLVESDIEL